MALFNMPTALDNLEDLLDRERKAILSGNLEALSRMVGEKTRLMERLGKAEADPGRVERLRIKAERNRQLLNAVQRGIRSVSEQLAAMKAQKTPLRTYDSSGQSRNISNARPSLEKRA